MQFPNCNFVRAFDAKLMVMSTRGIAISELTLTGVFLTPTGETLVDMINGICSENFTRDRDGITTITLTPAMITLLRQFHHLARLRDDVRHVVNRV